MENLMNVKTLPANATMFTGIGLMALARVFGMNPEFFAIGCGMMLLSASVGCLRQSTLVTGIAKSFDFFARRLWFDRTSFGSRCGHDANRGYCQFDSNWNVACERRLDSHLHGYLVVCLLVPS